MVKGKQLRTRKRGYRRRRNKTKRQSGGGIHSFNEGAELCLRAEQIDMSMYNEIQTNGTRSRIFIHKTDETRLIKYTNLHVDATTKHTFAFYETVFATMQRGGFIPRIYNMCFKPGDSKYSVPSVGRQQETASEYNCLMEMDRLKGDIAALLIEWLPSLALGKTQIAREKHSDILQIFKRKSSQIYLFLSETCSVTEREYDEFSLHLRQLFRQLIYQLNLQIFKMYYTLYTSNLFLDDFQYNNIGFQQHSLASNVQPAFGLTFENVILELLFIDFDEVKTFDDVIFEFTMAHIIRKRKRTPMTSTEVFRRFLETFVKDPNLSFKLKETYDIETLKEFKDFMSPYPRYKETADESRMNPAEKSEASSKEDVQLRELKGIFETIEIMHGKFAILPSHLTQRIFDGELDINSRAMSESINRGVQCSFLSNPALVNIYQKDYKTYSVYRDDSDIDVT